MTTVRVAVEVSVVGMSDADARAHARSILEARGFNVTATSIKRNPDGGRDFTPKPGHPGRMLTRDGREWQVWAQAPISFGYKGKGVWVVPADRRPDDAPVYLIDLEWPQYGMKPYTGDGKPIEEPKPARVAA